MPELTKQIVGYYKENRDEGEEFNQFLDRVGTQPMEEIAGQFRAVESLGPDTQDLYMDWNKDEVYKLERGEGECSV